MNHNKYFLYAILLLMGSAVPGALEKFGILLAMFGLAGISMARWYVLEMEWQEKNN